jgi:predicted nucleotidyltransferase
MDRKNNKSLESKEGEPLTRVLRQADTQKFGVITDRGGGGLLEAGGQCQHQPRAEQIDAFLKNKSMQKLLAENIDRIKDLCVSYNVKSLFAFGSVCTDRFNENSDVDLLISFNPMEYGLYADTYFELAGKFEEILNRRVDLVTDKSLSNPYLIESINQTKTLIYGA